MDGKTGIADDWTSTHQYIGFKLNFHPPGDLRRAGWRQVWELTDATTYVNPSTPGHPLAEYTTGKWQRVYLRRCSVKKLIQDVRPWWGLHYAEPLCSVQLYSGRELTSVTATDKYTVVFKWKTPNPEFVIKRFRHPAVRKVCRTPKYCRYMETTMIGIMR